MINYKFKHKLRRNFIFKWGDFLWFRKMLDDGIPIMFPNAWPIVDKSIFNLNQHWFARNLIFDSKIIENKLILTFKIKHRY